MKKEKEVRFAVGDLVEFDLDNEKAREHARLGPASQLKPKKIVSIEELSGAEAIERGYSQFVLCEDTSWILPNTYFKHSTI